MKDDTKYDNPETLLLNADRDQFITSTEAEELELRLNKMLVNARASFRAAVLEQEYFHPQNAYVYEGDDPGEEMFNLVWGGMVVENAGLFLAYANRGGWKNQILQSLDRCRRKGLFVGWWVRGWIEENGESTRV